GRARLLAEQIGYFIAEALASFRIGRLMTVAVVTTMVVALLVGGLVVLVGLDLSHLGETLRCEVRVFVILHERLSSAVVTRVLGDLVTGFLTGVSLIVVVNTILLTVSPHRPDIEIMQLVGATRWFIQWPLLLEGILEGTAVAAMASALLTGLYTLSAAAVRS